MTSPIGWPAGLPPRPAGGTGCGRPDRCCGCRCGCHRRLSRGGVGRGRCGSTTGTVGARSTAAAGGSEVWACVGGVRTVGDRARYRRRWWDRLGRCWNHLGREPILWTASWTGAEPRSLPRPAAVRLGLRPPWEFDWLTLARLGGADAAPRRGVEGAASCGRIGPGLVGTRESVGAAQAGAGAPTLTTDSPRCAHTRREDRGTPTRPTPRFIAHLTDPCRLLRGRDRTWFQVRHQANVKALVEEVVLAAGQVLQRTGCNSPRR